MEQMSTFLTIEIIETQIVKGCRPMDGFLIVFVCK